MAHIDSRPATEYMGIITPAQAEDRVTGKAIIVAASKLASLSKGK